MNQLESENGEFRYWLTLGIKNPGPFSSVLFVKHFPGTEPEGATIRKCTAYAERWGYTQLAICNLYAFKAESFDQFKAEFEARGADYVRGPFNDSHLSDIMRLHQTTVCAWGNGVDPNRVDRFKWLAQRAQTSLFCLGQNQDGSPVHPLYQPADAPMLLWPIPGGTKSDG